MKKKLATILLAVLFAVGLTGCGTFAEPPGDDGVPPSAETPVDPAPGPSETPEIPPEPSDEEDYFTVTVSLNGAKVSPGTSAQARWTQVDRNGNILSIPVSANFDSTGLAKTEGLDGNYRVTLVNLPSGFTYNPNIYSASNEKKEVDIEIFALNSTKNKGKNWYSDRINISSVGAQRVTLKSADDMARFSYQPTSNGVYHIESFCDIYTNEVNPVLQIHSGNSAAVTEYPDLVLNTGGSYGSFTKNFRYDYYLGEESTRGTLLFAVKAETKASYPVTVDILVSYEKPYETPVTIPVYPTEFDDVINESEVSAIRAKYSGDELEQKLAEYYSTHIYTKSQKIAYAANLMKANGSTMRPCYDENNHFSTKTFKFFDKSEDIDGDGIGDGDGYYHMWNEETQTYGSVICVTLNKDRFCFTTETGQAFADPKISCNYINGKDYTDFVKNIYTSYSTDGLYPVTREMQEFLQIFASSRAYFHDGDGWLEGNDAVEGETPDTSAYSASEGAMWLFACVYYA